jgi:type II secretory pathway predicted ATPase ExeA
MFERQFGLRENPFAAGHQSRFVYPSREHQEALAHLRFGIENREPFVMITGEVGTGKTTALYDVLSEWESRAVVALITNSALSRDELLEEICLRFGLALTGSMTKPQALVHLERFLQSVRGHGHRAILLLDEAQNLDRELLEEIRLLSNLETEGEKLIQVFLVGQPELEAKLASSELRPLRQRITVQYRLNPLSPDDTEHYIHHRISVAGGHAISIFPREACLEVHALTHGIPREINTVAAQAMLNAFVEDSPCVLPEHVHAVARDTEFRSVLRSPGDAGVASSASAAERSAPQAGVSITAVAMPPPVVTAVPVTASVAPPPPPVMHAPPAFVAPPPPEARIAEIAEPPAPPVLRAPEIVEAPAPPVLRAPGAAEAPAPPIVPAAPPELLPELEVEAEEHVTASPVQPAGTQDAWETWLSSFGDTAPVPVAGEPRPAASELARTEPAPAPAFSPVAPESNVAPPAPARAEAVAEPQRVAAASTTVALPRAFAPRDLEATHVSTTLPPRLRRKLEFDQERQRAGNGALRWMLAAAAVAVVVIGAMLAMRFGARSGKTTGASRPTVAASQSVPVSPAPTTPVPPEPPRSEAPITQVTNESSPALENAVAPPATEPARAKYVAPAPPRPATAASSGAVTGAEVVRTTRTVPVAQSVRPMPTVTIPTATLRAPTIAKTTSTKPAASRPLFGVAVGSYLNEDRAGQERTKLAASTRLPGRLLTVTEDNVAMYRVVLGAFEDRAAAERAASDLIEKGLVDEARVMALAKPAPPKP